LSIGKRNVGGGICRGEVWYYFNQCLSRGKRSPKYPVYSVSISIIWIFEREFLNYAFSRAHYSKWYYKATDQRQGRTQESLAPSEKIWTAARARLKIFWSGPDPPGYAHDQRRRKGFWYLGSNQSFFRSIMRIYVSWKALRDITPFT